MNAVLLTFIWLLVCASDTLEAAHRETWLPPEAVRGVLDLRSWSFEEGAVVPLDGEWEFYWRRLLTPGDFTGLSALPSAYIPVPRPWNGYEVEGERLPGEGYATYRLVVLLPDDAPPLMAVKMYSAATAYRMWIDGQLIATNGTVATRRDDGVAQASPRLVSFAPAGGPVEIVVQVSNFHHWRGGLWRRLQLGPASDVVKRNERDVALNAFLVGMILVVSLYHFAFWLGHRSYRVFLYFGLFSLSLMIRTFLLGEVLLTRIVPNFSYSLHLQLEYLPIMLGVPVIVAFSRELYPEEFSARFVRFSVVAGSIFAAFVLVAPTWLMSRGVIVYEFLTLLPILIYSLYLLAIAALRRRPMAGSWLVGAFAATAIGLNDMLHYQHVVSTEDLGLVGLVLLVLVQSVNLSRKFAQTLREQEYLADENRQLVTNLREHLRALQVARRLATEREEQLRRTIAEGLHGPVQNRLLHVWYQLGKVRDWVQRDGAKTADMIEQIRAEIDQVRENDIRELSHLLHPAIIQVGLLPALQSLVVPYRDHFEIELESEPEVRALDAVRANRIPEPIRLAVYRIVEEALANVAQHAQATKVSVVLRIAPFGPGANPDEDGGASGDRPAGPHLWITISDDGKGLPDGSRFGSNLLDRVPALSEGGGLGLHLIDGRVSDLEGVWSLTPSPEGGTRLQVWLPLPSKDE